MAYDLFPEGMFGVSTAVRDVLRRCGHIFINYQFNSVKMFTHEATCDDSSAVW